MTPLETLARASLPFQRLWKGRRVRRFALEEADGLSVAVLPDVFNGVVFRSGILLARTAAAFAPRGAFLRALDLGTGSGLGALYLARAGWRVLATDVNPEAVRCARANARRNGLSARVEVRGGDLFDPCASERFGLVLFNPPFFAGAPRDLHDLAWRGEGVFARFLDALPARLAPGGTALVVLSSHAPEQEEAARAAELQVSVAAARSFENETLTVLALRSAP